MKKTTVLIVGLVALLATAAGAQEVVITGFPLGVGTTVSDGFFKPFYPQLQELAEALKADPQARAVMVGQADGARYTDDNDAKNPGLSLGRAHALRNVLVQAFQVDPTQIFIQSNDVSDKGDRFRSVSVRIERPPVEPEPVAVPIVMQPPAEQPVVQPVEVIQNNNYSYDKMTLRLSGGISSTPFGALPVVSGAVIWNDKVGLDAVLGHTFWNDTYPFEGANLSTWRRLVGGRLTVYPWHDKPVGIMAGWVRLEEIAQSFYEFVKLSEGPVLGVGVTPYKHLSIVAMYNPARHRLVDREFSSAKHGQFLISLSLFTDFGSTP